MRASALGRTYALAVFVLSALAAAVARCSRRTRRDRRRGRAASASAGPPARPAASARLRRSRRRCRPRSSRRDGRTAIPPAAAPQAVKNAIYAANRIVGKPYRYGGGHRRFNDSRLRLLRHRQLRAARRRPAQAPAALARVHALGRGRQGPVDHRLHESRPRLRRDRRPAVRHVGARRARAALAQEPRARARALRGAPPRRLLAASAGSSSRAGRASARTRRPRRRPSATRAARARCRRPTGVPVETMSPGSSVIRRERCDTSAGTEKIRSLGVGRLHRLAVQRQRDLDRVVRPRPRPASRARGRTAPSRRRPCRASTAAWRTGGRAPRGR